MVMISFMGLQLNAQCLVADYPFNGNANNADTNLYNGIVHGATLTTDRFGNPNSAYSFDGVNDFIVIPPNNIFNFNSDFSISLWVKTTGDQLLVTSNQRNMIISKWSDNGSNVNGFPFDVRIGNYASSTLEGKISAYRRGLVSCNQTIESRSTTNVKDSSFHHIVFLKDGSQLKLYIDGSLEDVNTDFTTCTTSNPDSVYFGKKGGSWHAGWFKGIIDDVKFFNCALDSTEIISLGGCQTVDSITQSACGVFASPTGKLWYSSGIYTDTLTNSLGCDSILSYDLTINNVPSSAVVVTNNMLTAQYPNGTYQWLDCGTNQIIPGQTSATYVATTSGSYAVIVTDSLGCTNTSSCYWVTFVGIDDVDKMKDIRLFPNPTSGVIHVQNVPENAQIEIFNLQGQKTNGSIQQSTSNNWVIDLTDQPIGSYVMRITDQAGNTSTRKISIQR